MSISVFSYFNLCCNFRPRTSFSQSYPLSGGSHPARVEGGVFHGYFLQTAVSIIVLTLIYYHLLCTRTVDMRTQGHFRTTKYIYKLIRRKATYEFCKIATMIEFKSARFNKVNYVCFSLKSLNA